MRTPLVVVTGVDPHALDSAMLGLSWGVPGAVVVRHRIDPHAQALTRVVSDATGVLEEAALDLEHACVGCALREDVLPTLERLVRDGRWRAIVAGLPVATEADQLSALLARDARLARRLRLASVVAAVGAAAPVDDLLSDASLEELGRQTSLDDDRGVGEVACAQVELADAVVLPDDPGAEAADRVRALARPDADVFLGVDRLDATALTGRRHDHRRAVDWRMPTDVRTLPPLARGTAWRLLLSSPRPFHPDRLVDDIESLGAGRHRSRGCFWLPTRPGVVQEWSGAGGQLSIGSHSAWGRRTPLTRLVVTGTGAVPDGLETAFKRLLVSPEEALLDGRTWAVREDGLEPWLGEIADAA